MGIFRADNNQPSDEEDLDNQDPVDNEDYYLGNQNRYDDEKERLNDVRSSFGQNNLDRANYSNDDESKALSKANDETPSTFKTGNLLPNSNTNNKLSHKSPKNTKAKKSKSKLNKKIAIGLVGFLGPTLVGLFLFILALQAGFALEHITRITTGLRFGPMQIQLSKRLNHVRREHVRLIDHNQEGIRKNNISRYTTTTLFNRFTGVTPDSIWHNLNKQGYKFEYKKLDGSPATWGRRTLVRVQLPDGSTRDIKNSKDFFNFLDEKEFVFDDRETSRYRAFRSSTLLSQQVGIPFLRFRTVMRELKQLRLDINNPSRASPKDFVNQRIQNMNNAILKVKSDLARRVNTGFLGQVSDKFNVDSDNLSPATLSQNVDRNSILNKFKGMFDSSKRTVVGATAKVSALVGIGTIACVIRELGGLIRDAFKIKIRGLQDSGATLMTTTSQIKAGDMDQAVVADLSQRFEGFASSANYQVAVLDKPVDNYIGYEEIEGEGGYYSDLEGYSYSQEFAANTMFASDGLRGLSLSVILKISDILNPFPEKEEKNISDYVISNEGDVREAPSENSGTWGKFWGWVGDKAKKLTETAVYVVTNPTEATLSVIQKSLQWGIGTVCNVLLSTVGQITIATVEVVAVVISSFFTGGGAAAGWAALKASLGILAGTAAGILIDDLLFKYLLPGILMDASGVNTALLPSQSPQDGARNYAIVDYGMHYLKEGEASNLGGQQIPVQSYVAQTQLYLAQQKQDYANQGLWNNIFALDNPYSLASSLAIIKTNYGSWPQKATSYLSQLSQNLSLKLDPFKTVYAQNNNDRLAHLLYPGQKYVMGFDNRTVDDAVLSETESKFRHIENTIYVEENEEELSQYSECIGVDIAEIFMEKAEKGEDKYYQDYQKFCGSEDALRYKVYYQDCLLLDSIAYWGKNASPMYSSRCDHLLSPENQILLKEPTVRSEGDEASLFDSHTKTAPVNWDQNLDLLANSFTPTQTTVTPKAKSTQTMQNICLNKPSSFNNFSNQLKWKVIKA